MQEKAQLVKELKALRAHYGNYEPALAALQAKYDAALREKMLVSLERDRQRDAAAEAKRRLAEAEAARDADTIKGAATRCAARVCSRPVPQRAQHWLATIRRVP